MKVYVAFWNSEDSSHIVGVFSTEAAADRAGENFDSKDVFGKRAHFGFTQTLEFEVDGAAKESLL